MQLLRTQPAETEELLKKIWLSEAQELLEKAARSETEVSGRYREQPLEALVANPSPTSAALAQSGTEIPQDASPMSLALLEDQPRSP